MASIQSREPKRGQQKVQLYYGENPLCPTLGILFIYACVVQSYCPFPFNLTKQEQDNYSFLSTNKGNQFSDITIKDEFFGIWNPVFISLINGCLEDAGTKTLCDGVFVTHCLWTCFRRSRDAIFDHQTLFLPLSLIWRLRPPKSKLFQEDHSR